MRGWIVLLFAAMVGCSSANYRYLPAQNQASNRPWRGEAVYSVPSNHPTGLVRVYSMGIVDLKPKGEDKKIPALQVRVALSNQSETENWTFNIQDQIVSFPNQGTTNAVLANSDTNLPNLEIKPRELRTLDLFFPLPENAKSEDQLPNFDFHWQIKAGDVPVRETTAFDRVQLPEHYEYPYTYYSAGWGPVWWGGPYYYPYYYYHGPAVRYRP